ncbi:DNA repair protein RecN [Aureispira anguillae]|nr:DNA repair protein RecN [Aureispira anguillae]
MIRTLTIQNYAIIEELVINFSNNLTIITGETGAGKSIMLGGLGLIMGKRADTKVLYQQDSKCIVEGVFDVSPYGLQDFFEANDLDYEEETCIRREITPSGKSRAFVNDTPVRLGVLKELSNKLIDLHQQFDTLDIHDPLFQVRVIDAIADNKKLLGKYQTEFRAYEESKRALARLIKQSQDANKETDFLTYQLNELTEAELKLGEMEALEMEQKRLNNAEDIQRILGGAAMHITENENSVCSQLTDLSNSAANLVEFHPKLPQILEQFDSLVLELEEIGNQFHVIAEDTEHDGDRLLEVNERLSILFNLANKYHVQNDEELIQLRSELEEKLGGFEDISEQMEALNTQIKQQEQKLLDLGKRLSQRRQKVTTKFQKSVQKLLAQLSMQYARLEVEIVSTQEFTPTGTDRLRFLFAANKGSRLEEIKGVASGGELSRLALCIKSLVASAIPLPTLIFDEIDAGVSGEVALQMGIILKQLSSEHQVISITHSPQIAAKANTHYFVRKKVTGNKTTTFVSELNQQERILEIAKMLSGNPPSDVAKENARELLGC